MEVRILKEIMQTLEENLCKSSADRQYAQIEKETIETFLQLTKHKVNETDNQISLTNRKMELKRKNLQIETNAYARMLKQEKGNNDDQSTHSIPGNGGASDEERIRREQLEIKRELEWSKKQRELTKAESYLKHVNEIVQEKENSAKLLLRMKDGYQKSLASLIDKSIWRLEKLELDLQSQKKLAIENYEEKRNLQITKLIKNHHEAFGEMKKHFADATSENLKTIQLMKEEIQKSRKRAAAKQKQIDKGIQVNKNLARPLEFNLRKVSELEALLKDRQKDQLALTNAKARLLSLVPQLSQLQAQFSSLQEEVAQTEKERDDIYESFEAAIRAVQQKSDFQNMVLETKLQSVEERVCRTAPTMETASDMGAFDVHEIERQRTAGTSALAAEKDELICQLQQSILESRKAYEQTFAIYNEQMTRMGIPQMESSNFQLF